MTIDHKRPVTSHGRQHSPHTLWTTQDHEKEFGLDKIRYFLQLIAFCGRASFSKTQLYPLFKVVWCGHCGGIGLTKHG